MRILHLSEHLINGGLETHILCLCRKLLQDGHKPSIFAMNMSSEFREQAEATGVECIVNSKPGQDLKNYITQNKIQLLHCHPERTIRLGAALGKELGLPVVVTYHGFYGWNLPSHPSVDKIICVSDEVYDRLAAADPSSASKLVLIKNGVETEVFAPTWRKPKKGWKILFIGRLDLEKYVSLRIIIRALSSIPNVRLLVAGSGPYLNKLKAQAPPWVTFLGYVKDMPRIINRVNLIIATGRGIREALSCGKPAISLDNGGYDGIVSPETVADFEYHNFMGRSGQKLTPECLLKDIRELFDNNRLRARLCTWGRNYAIQNFSAETFYKENLELYHEVTKNKLSPGAAFSSNVRRRPVICFAAIDWDFLFQRPHQLMMRLASRGHPVYFRESGQLPGTKLKNVLPNLWVCRDFNQIPKQDLENALYFVYLPVWASQIEPSEKKFIIYDCVDDFPEFSLTEDQMFKLADLVICSSGRLMIKHFDKHSRMLFIPNGADINTFRPKTDSGSVPDLPGGDSEAVVGFAGAMYHEWVDIDLIYHIARSRPQWKVVVIGHTYTWDFTEAPPNLIHIERQPVEKLAKYLHAFDVGLIPFLNNQISQYSDPIKLYEYMASGLPVVSSSLPFVRNLRPPLIYSYNNKEECLEAIEQALADDRTDRTGNVVKRLEFANCNTWDDRVEAIMAEVSRMTWTDYS